MVCEKVNSTSYVLYKPMILYMLYERKALDLVYLSKLSVHAGVDSSAMLLVPGISGGNPTARYQPRVKKTHFHINRYQMGHTLDKNITLFSYHSM